MDLVAAVFLASHVPRDSGPHQGLTGTWCVWLPPAPHLDLGFSSTPETTLDLVTVVPTWASPGFGDSGPLCTHLALLTMFLKLAKLGPGDCVPQFDLTWAT